MQALSTSLVRCLLRETEASPAAAAALASLAEQNLLDAHWQGAPLLPAGSCLRLLHSVAVCCCLPCVLWRTHSAASLAQQSALHVHSQGTTAQAATLLHDTCKCLVPPVTTSSTRPSLADSCLPGLMNLLQHRNPAIAVEASAVLQRWAGRRPDTLQLLVSQQGAVPACMALAADSQSAAQCAAALRLVAVLLRSERARKQLSAGGDKGGVLRLVGRSANQTRDWRRPEVARCIAPGCISCATSYPLRLLSVAAAV